MQNKAIFLDRDGVINVDHNYVYKIEELKFIPNSIKALQNLQKQNYKLIIITNQSGIGRGYYTEENYKAFRKEMHKRLQKEGVKIDEEYYSPFKSEDNSKCRKPSPYLIEKAIKKFDINKDKSFMIGDKTSDILAGKNAGVKTFLVLTGKAGNDKSYDVKSDYICKDLYEASKIIIGKE